MTQVCVLKIVGKTIKSFKIYLAYLQEKPRKPRTIN